MHEVEVTLVGRIGQEPVLRSGSRGDFASFTVATNPRFKQGEAWVDGPTSWFSVKADGDLGRHVIASLTRGQQVIVHGTVSVRSSGQQDGARQTFVDVQAHAVGPDLRWGTARFSGGERRGDRSSARPQQPLGRAADPEQERTSAAAVQPAWASAGFPGDEDAPF